MFIWQTVGHNGCASLNERINMDMDMDLKFG
jgi:hypothetical protein